MPLFYLRQFDRLRLQMWKLVKVRVTQLNEVKSFALDASFNEIVKFSLQSCSELKVGADVVNKEEEEEARMRQKD